MIAQIPSRDASALKPRNHIRCPAPAGECDSDIGAAYVNHLLVANVASGSAEALPVSRVALDRYPALLGPFSAEPVSPSRLAFDQHGDPMLAQDRVKASLDKQRVGKIAPACHDNPFRHAENMA